MLPGSRCVLPDSQGAAVLAPAAAKLGQSKESLRLLKAYNMVQSLLTAMVSHQQLSDGLMVVLWQMPLQGLDALHRCQLFAKQSGLRPPAARRGCLLNDVV